MNKTKVIINPLKRLFPIDKEEPKTWPWSDCMVSGEGSNLKVRWIKNPDFKYGDLIPGY